MKTKERNLEETLVADIDYNLVHHATRNKTFLAMYKFLKTKGVKNNKFFLRLYDRKLMFVNPFDKNLSDEIKARIIREVSINPWYYYREIYRIPEAGGSIKFGLHRGNLAQLFLAELNFSYILELPRQTGKTWGLVSNFDWTYNYGGQNISLLTMNKSNADAQGNIQRYKDARSLLPEYLKFTDKADVDNKTQIRSGKSKNELKMVPTANDAVAADKAGRGLTAPKVWVDEAAFVKYFNIIYVVSSPVQTKASESAKRNRVPYGRALTSTPNFLDCTEGAFYYSLIQGAAKFSESLFDMTREEIDAYIFENSENNLCYIKYTWEELGKTREWYEHQCREMANDRIRIKRELDLLWTFAVDNSPFDEEELEIIQQGLSPILDSKIFFKKYNFEIYLPIDPNKPYPIGIDVAGGLERDSTVFHVTDEFAEKTVTIFKSNKISTEQTKLLILEVSVWLPKSFFIIERNSYGLAIIQSIMEDSRFVSLRSRIFFRFKEEDRNINSGTAQPEMTKLSQNSKKTKVYGLDTGVKSRDVYFELLTDIVREHPDWFNAPPFFAELKTLEVKKNGKIEHRTGFHDDVILSRLLVAYARIRTTWKRFCKTSTNYSTATKLAQKGGSGVLKTVEKDLSEISRNLIDLGRRMENEREPSNNLAGRSILKTIKNLNQR
jgi:hypothetical protein